MVMNPLNKVFIFHFDQQQATLTPLFDNVNIENSIVQNCEGPYKIKNGIGDIYCGQYVFKDLPCERFRLLLNGYRDFCALRFFHHFPKFIYIIFYVADD